MIQRIQTIWLFLAALTSALLMLNWHTGYVFFADIPEGFGSVVKRLTVTEHFPSLLIAAVMIILPLVAIFMYGDRKRQRLMAIMTILACISFTAVNLMRIENFKRTNSPAPTNGSYDLGSLLPVLVIVFLILAIRGINKDQKLIKSMDRLR
jgi:hypothetical protein